MSGGSKCSPHSSSAFSSAESTSSRPRKSARANGPGIIPVPIIIPRSMSRTPAMPSSSTRQASTIALSEKRSATLGSICWSAVLIEALPGLGTQLARFELLLHPAMHVHAVAVGLAHVARHLDHRVQARHVGHAERPHRHVGLLLDELVELFDVDPRLVLVAPDL